MENLTHQKMGLWDLGTYLISLAYAISASAWLDKVMQYEDLSERSQKEIGGWDQCCIIMSENCHCMVKQSMLHNHVWKLALYGQTIVPSPWIGVVFWQKKMVRGLGANWNMFHFSFFAPSSCRQKKLIALIAQETNCKGDFAVHFQCIFVRNSLLTKNILSKCLISKGLLKSCGTLLQLLDQIFRRRWPIWKEKISIQQDIKKRQHSYIVRGR